MHTLTFLLLWRLLLLWFHCCVLFLLFFFSRLWVWFWFGLVCVECVSLLFGYCSCLTVQWCCTAGWTVSWLYLDGWMDTLIHSYLLCWTISFCIKILISLLLLFFPLLPTSIPTVWHSMQPIALCSCFGASFKVSSWRALFVAPF